MRTISRLFATTVLVLSFASMQAAAQGPAGAGAGAAAGGGTSSHSYNPMKWIGKKDAKPTADAPFANDEPIVSNGGGSARPSPPERVQSVRGEDIAKSKTT